MVAKGQSGISIQALCLLAVIAALPVAGSALAAESSEIAAHARRPSEAPPAIAAARVGDIAFGSAFGDLRKAEAAPQPTAAVVSFGRALDLSGQKRIYSSRTAISGLGAVISFSDRRPRPLPIAMTSLQLASIPSGMPLAARSLTSGFGMRLDPLLGGRRLHAGIDLAAPLGTPIVATSDGVVSTADWSGGYGLLVGIEHGGGLQTRYGHMSQLAVACGQAVRRGDVIGYVGSTGRSTGPHLHYEVRIHGQAIDPRGR